MKRILTTGLLLMGLGAGSALAQSSSNFDDIYYTESDAQKDAAAEKKRTEKEAARRQAEAEKYDSYSSSGAPSNRGFEADNSARSYGNDGDGDSYIDYDDDDFSYATRLNRFNNPWMGVGYFNSFYNPYWYDPYMGMGMMGMGWGGWGGPGFGISVGYGGPYWSSAWSYYNWYGYPGFNSFYNYPFYGGGWYGGYFGAPYYSGFWNGYYAGGLGYGNGFRSVSYAPRYSLDSRYNGNRFGNRSGLRGTVPANNGGGVGGTRSGFRGTRNVETGAPVQAGAPSGRNSIGRDGGAMPNRGRSFSNDAPVQDTRNNNGSNAAGRSRFDNAPASAPERSTNRPNRGWMSESRPAQVPDRAEMPRNNVQPQMEQPRFQQPRQSAPRFEQPRMQPQRQFAPRMESAPQRSFNNGGGGGFRSGGGGGFRGGSSGGGGGFRGGGRR